MNTPKHEEAGAYPSKIQIADGCPPRFANAVEAFQQAVEGKVLEAQSRGARIASRSVAKLMADNMNVAFASAVAEITGGSDVSYLLQRWFGMKGLHALANQPHQLHIVLKTAHAQLRGITSKDIEITGLIDTMREVSFFLQQWPLPERVVPRHEHGKKGASARLRSAEERHFLSDWPYCELCWKLSEHAQEIEHSGGELESGRSVSLQERFCADHARNGGSLYRPHLRRKDRFHEILNAIYAEMRLDSQFRKRFDLQSNNSAWSLAKSLPATNFEQFAMRNLTPASPLQMSARYVAYKIAERRPQQIERIVKIARIQREAMMTKGEELTLTEIANLLGVFKTVISRAFSLGGYVDLERTSPLLHWWPFDDLEDSTAFCVRSPRSTKAAPPRENWKDFVERKAALYSQIGL